MGNDMKNESFYELLCYSLCLFLMWRLGQYLIFLSDACILSMTNVTNVAKSNNFPDHRKPFFQTNLFTGALVHILRLKELIC